MAEERQSFKMPHNVILEDRKALTVSGVSDVDSFDDQTVVIFTDMGELTVRGSGLHISKLSVETGELTMEGSISQLSYSDDQPHSGGGLLSRLFK
ncbi:MAG: sporulation protein YabP [Clostridiales bacterium]|nr:sporulation protein YabP [Clostridiales bacterium]